MADTSVDFNAIPTLAEAPRFHARERPNAVALTFEGRETTYAQFDAASNRAAQALLAEGLTKGDRIAYLGKNSDHYFELLFGAAKIGVIMAPIGWRLAPPEVAYIAGDAQARQARRKGGEEIDGDTLRALTRQPLLAVKPQQPLDIGLFETRLPEAPHIVVPDE